MRPEAFEPMLRALPGEMPPLAAAEFRPGVLSDLLETHLARSANRHLILTGVRRAPDVEFNQVVERLEAVAPDLLAADGKSFVAHLVTIIYAEMATVGWVGLVLILVPLLIGLRRPSRIAPVLLPPLVSLVWTFGIMGWCGIRINMMNCIVGVFVFGLVIDYAIFLRAARERREADGEQHLAHAGGAVAISALTTLLGVGSLALSSHPALRTVGLTAATGIACGWLAVLLIVPLSAQSSSAAAAGALQVRPVSSK